MVGRSQLALSRAKGRCRLCGHDCSHPVHVYMICIAHCNAANTVISDMRLQAIKAYGQLHAFPSLTIDHAGSEEAQFVTL